MNSLPPSVWICAGIPNFANQSLKMASATISASLLAIAMTTAYLIKASVMQRTNFFSELFKELNQVKPAETHWTFTSPAAMIGIALALFLIGMLFWKKCFSTSQSLETPPPAPSSPTMPTHNQPHIHCATPATNNQATKSNASIPIHINIS